MELKLTNQSVSEDKLHGAEQTIAKMGGQESVEKRLEIVYGASVLEKIFSLCDAFFAKLSHPNEMLETEKIDKIIENAGTKLFRLIFDFDDFDIPAHEEHKNCKDAVKMEHHFHVRKISLKSIIGVNTSARNSRLCD